MLYFIIDLIFQILYICLIARVIISWMQINQKNQVIQFVNSVTEPILKPIRDNLPQMQIGVDISPIIAFIALGFIKKIITWVMFQ